MPKMTAPDFIEKYGTAGLKDAIGCKTEGNIARGNDYARVHDLLIELKRLEDLKPPKTEYQQWYDARQAMTPVERLHLPAFSQVVYNRQQEKINRLIASEEGMARSCAHYRETLTGLQKKQEAALKILADNNLFYEVKCELIAELLKDD